MKLAARFTPNTPIAIGKTWFFPDGSRCHVVAGAAEGDELVSIPEDLTIVEPDDLISLEEQVVAEIDRHLDEESDDFATMTALADGLERIRAEKTRRVTEAANASEERERIRQRVHAEAEGEGDPDDDGGDGDPPDPDAPVEPGDGAEAEGSRELITAGGGAPPPAPTRRPASAAGTSRRAGRPPMPAARPQVTITAAADLPGINSGAVIDIDQVALSMHDKARTLSDRSARIPIAQFKIPYATGDVIQKKTSKESALEIIDRVSDPSRLWQNGALVAAGGWCTPSQNLYDLLALDGATGLLDIPSVGVERGGLNVPSYIGIDAADGALWIWCEDDDLDINVAIGDLDIVAGVGTMNTTGPHLLDVGDLVDITSTNPLANGPHTVLTVTDADTVTLDMTGVPDAANATGSFIRQKSCFTIPCPTWEDTRLCAYGLCIRHGNLMDRSFPELSRRYAALVVNAHLHRMSAINIAKIRSAVNAVPVVMTAVGTDSYGELMSALELGIVDYRSEHKISDRVVIEVLLPSWTQEMLRANLAMRAGVDLLAVSDAQIAAYFAVRNVRPQFLEDYQPMWNGAPRVVWPTTIEAIIYPAGDFIEGNGGTIDLGVQRDSRLNATNDFTLAWSEDFRLLVRRGPLARRLTITLSTDGVTACCP